MSQMSQIRTLPLHFCRINFSIILLRSPRSYCIIFSQNVISLLTQTGRIIVISSYLCLCSGYFRESGVSSCLPVLVMDLIKVSGFGDGN